MDIGSYRLKSKAYMILCVAAFLLSSCGSIRTVTSSNGSIGYDLYRNKTYCEKTTRIYSGVAYDFCRFNAAQKGSYTNYLETGFFLFDIALFSPVLDTVLLPVTIYQQATYGSIKVYEPR